MSSGTDTKTRKWMLTFQSSQIVEDGWSHEVIKQALKALKLDYWAMVDEIGGKTGSLHTHLILYRENDIRATTLRKRFPNVHQDALHGSMEESRNYLLKSGKYANTEKAETTIAETFEEGGKLPIERGKGHRSDIEQAIQMIKEGYTDLEIIDAIPSMFRMQNYLKSYRQKLAKQNASKYRKMTVIYIFGETRTGKTSSVYAQYKDNPECICTINSYQGNGVFDEYESVQTMVLCLDEFRSSLPFGFLLALTDGHPQTINCRYENRIATHTAVYIISNIPLEDQYRQTQVEEPPSWQALLRRISTVRHFYALGKHKDYTVEEYFDAVKRGTLNNWTVAMDEDNPFENGEPQEAASQLQLPL